MANGQLKITKKTNFAHNINLKQMATNNAKKVIIEKHVERMLEDLGKMNDPIGWIPENATDVLTEIFCYILLYGKGVEDYLEKNGLLKEQ